jgi:hypothetical protein
MPVRRDRNAEPNCGRFASKHTFGVRKSLKETGTNVLVALPHQDLSHQEFYHLLVRTCFCANIWQEIRIAAEETNRAR